MRRLALGILAIAGCERDADSSPPPPDGPIRAGAECVWNGAPVDCGYVLGCLASADQHASGLAPYGPMRSAFGALADPEGVASKCAELCSDNWVGMGIADMGSGGCREVMEIHTLPCVWCDGLTASEAP